MEDDAGRDLFVRGVAAARAREYAEARRYLEWSLGQDPPRERRVEALIWLAEVCPDPAEQRRFIEEALVYDPSEPRARRKLAILNGQLDPEKIIDPDQVLAQHPATGGVAQHPAPAGEELADARRFTCPNCGGRMVFLPDGHSLVCEYCATPGKGRSGQMGSPGQAPEEENFLVAMATLRGHANPVKTKTFSCQGCGTSFVLPPQQLSLTCPYCESVYVIENQQAAELVEPGAVIPFAVDTEAAHQAAHAWLQAEQPSARLVSGQAIYTPVWTFDLGGQISWRCEVKIGRDRWEKQTGEQLLYYNDLLVPASTHLSPLMRAELDHFDLAGFKPYDPAYLADWPAETYQVRVSQAALEARQQAYQREQERARPKMIFQEVRNLVFSSTGIIVEAFKLALLPFWLVRAESDGRRFELVVNGQTGRVSVEKNS